MSSLIRALIGVLTTVVFLWIGFWLWNAEQPLVGGALIVLGAFRGVVAVRQLTWAFRRDEDDPAD